MAVYIRTSPPREGVRGGREDFKWESLLTNQDYDYYLGASVKIGLHSRGGKFEKYDWWTKRRGGASETELEAELQRVRNFEAELMGEALGDKPKNLLVGNPYETGSKEGVPAATGGDEESDRGSSRLRKEKKKKKKKDRKEKQRKRKRSRRISTSSSSRSRSPSSSAPPGRSARRDSRGTGDPSDRHDSGHCLSDRELTKVSKAEKVSATSGGHRARVVSSGQFASRDSMEKAAEKCSSPVPTCGSRNIPMRRTRSGSQVKSESADARLGSRRRISDKFADEYCSRSSFRSDNRTSKGLTTGAVKRERHSRSRERDSLPTAATSRSCAGESTSRKEDPQHTGERAHARKVYSSSPDGKCGSRFHKRRLSQDRPARRNDRGRECDLDPYAHRRRR